MHPSRSILLVSAALAVIAGCGEKAAEETAQVVRPVKTATVQGFRPGEFTFPATVDAGRKLVVSFRIPGRIVELPVRKGQAVGEGALIAKLDPADYEIAVQEAQATFQKTEADYERYRTLYEKNAVPLADLDQRRAQRDVAKARLDEARKNLGYTILRAPFAGMIGNRYVENFMDVSAQQEIVDLNDTTTVDVRIDASETIVAPLKQYGDRLELRTIAEFDAAPGKQYPLELKEIAARADPNTQTFQIVFTMPQPDDITLLPGMTGRVRINADLKAGVNLDVTSTVPSIAVETQPTGECFVWVVDPETMTVRRRPVKVGKLRGTDDIVVLEGLAAGERVVTAGLAQLSDGMAVRYWEEQGQP
jgi:RND family efflux transporter MFP subunit